MHTQLRRILTVSSALAVFAAFGAPAFAQQSIATVDLNAMGMSFRPDAARSSAAAPRRAGTGGFDVGVLVGPLFDKTASDDSTFSGKTGMQFSVFLGGHRAGFIGLATELTLQRRRSDADGDTLTFTTLQVPIFLRVNVGAHSAGGARIYVKAGPAIDVVLSARSEAFGDVKDVVNVFQVDVIAGAGVEVNRFIIEGRYIQGIRSINKDASIESIRTRAFALLFGFRFN